MKVMVMGGAGYIGSSCSNVLIENGYDVVIVDSLVTGHIEAVPQKAKFYQCDICSDELKDIILKENIDSVIDFAAFSLVGESMKDPYKYYDNNVSKTNKMLKTLVDCNVKYVVFSSTAATYGEPVNIPIVESDPTVPTNVYGQTKLVMEKMFDWYSKAYGIKYVALRYFNACGAVSKYVGESHNPETHLIPLMVQSMLGKRDKLKVFGDDYDTPDGSCIRDYVHVYDLSMAHIKALEYLKEGNDNNVFNLGSGKGYSVFEMIEALNDLNIKKLEYTIDKRREGDPKILVASSEKAKKYLHWEPVYQDIKKIIEDAYLFEINRKY